MGFCNNVKFVLILKFMKLINFVIWWFKYFFIWNIFCFNNVFYDIWFFEGLLKLRVFLKLILFVCWIDYDKMVYWIYWCCFDKVKLC